MKLITVYALISLHQVSCFENCNRFCNKTPHTECYPQGGGDQCLNNERVYLDSSEKRTILDFHNDLRSKVADGLVGKFKLKSANMMKLVWNGELGLLAKRWADQCKEGQHDECRTARDGNETGQNSYMGIYKNTGSINDQKTAERFKRLKKMLTAWSNEITLVTRTDIRSVDANRVSAIGNVTQMIWAETTYIGCGYTEFDLGNNLLMYRFVCDYKPSGNIQSKAVFLEGSPCSKCPKGSKCSESLDTICFNGESNDFIDDSKAYLSKASFYTIAMFTGVSLLRLFSCALDRINGF